METTCVLIKPDAILAHKIGEIIARFEKAGLEITNLKMFSLAPEVLAQHYGHLLDRAFYPELEGFMRSSPIVALAVTGADAVTAVRALAGPTDPAKSKPGTIRADFGKDVMANAVHASDSPEAAAAELERFGLV